MTTDAPILRGLFGGLPLRADVRRAMVPDLPPFEGQTVSYVIASSPRSGSYLLCENLARSGRLGLPAEYANIRYILRESVRWQASSLREYFAEMVRRRSTGNGVFGMKVHYGQFMTLRGHGLDLDPDAWIFIERHNAVAQAISFARAAQTQAWTSFHEEQTAPVYNFAQIRSCLRTLAAEAAGWEGYFKRRSIEPLRIAYPDVVSSPDVITKRVLNLLGVAGDEPSPVETTTHERQADTTNVEWTERYLADCAEHGLDPLTPRTPPGASGASGEGPAQGTPTEATEDGPGSSP